MNKDDIMDFCHDWNNRFFSIRELIQLFREYKWEYEQFRAEAMEYRLFSKSMNVLAKVKEN